MSDSRDAVSEMVRGMSAAFDTISRRLTRLEAKVFGDGDSPGDEGSGPEGPDSGPGPLFNPDPTLQVFEDLSSELFEIRDHIKDIYTKMERIPEIA